VLCETAHTTRSYNVWPQLRCWASSHIPCGPLRHKNFNGTCYRLGQGQPHNAYPIVKRLRATFKKWSRIGVEGTPYIYSFENKCLCLKSNNPHLYYKKREVVCGCHPLSPLLGPCHRPHVGQYFSHNNMSICVVRYDDGAFVYASPSNNVAVINLIDIETIRTLMSQAT
jgi:hypothetical protein